MIWIRTQANEIIPWDFDSVRIMENNNAEWEIVGFKEDDSNGFVQTKVLGVYKDFKIAEAVIDYLVGDAGYTYILDMKSAEKRAMEK